MLKPFLRTVTLGVLLPLALGASATAGTVKLTPVKGATYAGLVQGHLALTVKVDRKGKTAKVSLPDAPAFCSSGGGPEPHSSAPATISKQGALSATITFFTTGSTRRKLATVTIKGHFYTFGKAKPVLQGTAKSKFAIAGVTTCDGQVSFQAVKR